MNLDSIASHMGSQVTRAANNADASMKSDLANNPEDMLKSQFDLNQYSVLIGYESSVLKTIKEMMMGIISKIG
ncbi:MAG: type III secretion system needle filament subunit SctF [Burkholderiaceae bacterium]|nr:type III secretion system needle filament subunit SctF [Burkholderiaceae bacterium]